MEKYFIEIGDRLIEYVEIHELVTPNPPLEPIGRITFTVRLDNNRLKEIDLKDTVRVYTTDNQILMGYIEQVVYTNSFATFVCEGYKRSFKTTQISVEFLNLERSYLVKGFWFLARLFNEPENIQMDEKMMQQANFTERSYVVLMPIDNLELDRPLKIQDVLFTNSLDDDDYDIIKSSNTFSSDSDWSIKKPKGKVVVKATNFYDAVMKGYNRILTIINLITFRNDLSFIYYNDSEVMEFNNSLFFSRINPIMKIFCREVNSDHAMFYDLKPKERTICRTHNISDKYFFPIKDFEKIYNDQNLEQPNPIILSIQWLSLSIYADDPIVKLLNLWNSLEFAISRLPSQRKFSKTEIEILRKEISTLLTNSDPHKKVNLSEEQIEIVMSKLDYLNDPPIIEMIKNFLRDNQIPFSDQEMDIIKKSRSKRNNIQHGRKHQIIKEEELEKLRSLIEKILLIRIQQYSC